MNTSDLHHPRRSQLLPPATSYQTSSTHVDWNGIYEASLKAVGHCQELRLHPADALRQLRTIHMGGGRQNGKTAWAVNMLSTDGTIVVACNKDMRQDINRRFCLKNLTETITITIPADCANPYDVVEGLLQEYHRATVPNVFTLMDLTAILEKEPEKLRGVNRVIIDDFSYNTKVRDIYVVLANLDNPDLIVVALN